MLGCVGLDRTSACPLSVFTMLSCYLALLLAACALARPLSIPADHDQLPMEIPAGHRTNLVRLQVWLMQTANADDEPLGDLCAGPESFFLCGADEFGMSLSLSEHPAPLRDLVHPTPAALLPESAPSRPGLESVWWLFDSASHEVAVYLPDDANLEVGYFLDAADRLHVTIEDGYLPNEWRTVFLKYAA